MLGAVILAFIVSVGLILFGGGLLLLAFFAEAMTPIPGQAKAAGVGITGAVLLAIGAVLLVLTLWPDPADAAPLLHVFRAARV